MSSPRLMSFFLTLLLGYRQEAILSSVWTEHILKFRAGSQNYTSRIDSGEEGTLGESQTTWGKAHWSHHDRKCPGRNAVRRAKIL